ncbi:heat shock protein GrpE [Halosimplex carlsbadense 2-9-1]|uniref:Protein GrpE n=1 Tax=Halosimplex carlsbadense 2-9-1 TaxID=797114 RepID=M0CR18_9EURY|nr:nucleotide exchange factor GrpE [Halosimplex carlsbadense]ELZ25063.1 heat shock protein GrpE [Halosimplex carlsbadense 2-9-1]
MSEQDASDPAEAADEQPGATAQEGDASDEPVQPDEVIDADEAGDGDGSSDAAADGEVAVDEQLVDRVAESDPESVARELAALRTRVDGLEDQLDDREGEIEELTEKLKRKQAEFQNFKKRMEKRREEEEQRATEDLVTRLLDVRDNLQRALEQDEDADIRGGVESTLRSFDDVLDAENVDVVEPEPGEDVDPHRHEVLVRVDSDQPEGAIAEVHRPGYEMADKVIREAQVTVSDGAGQ